MHRGASASNNKSEEDVNTTADALNNIVADEDELEQPLIPGWMLKYFLYLEKKIFRNTTKKKSLKTPVPYSRKLKNAKSKKNNERLIILNR